MKYVCARKSCGKEVKETRCHKENQNSLKISFIGIAFSYNFDLPKIL
jgi:hypothetical protein